ncbi:MAG: prolyl oligopeptidase family serine peptidase, partial [Pseudomonadota bacterium]
MMLLLVICLLAAGACGGKGGKAGARHPAEGAVEAAAPTERTESQIARDSELAEAASALIDLHVNHSHDISADGKTITFVSDRDGLSQVYLAQVDKPKDPPVRLTETTERCEFPRFTPDGKHIVYVSDTGGNQRYRIFSVAAGGGEPVCLTPDEGLERHAPFMTADGSTMVYSAGSMEEGKTLIFSQPLAGGEAKQIVSVEGMAFLMALSADGGTGLFLQAASLSDIKVLALDVKKAAMRRIYPAEGKEAAVFGAALSIDGKDAFVGTDGGGQQAMVLRLDIDSGEEKARYLEDKVPTGVFKDMKLTPDGKTLLARLTAGAHDALRLLDTVKLEPVAGPKIPAGRITGLWGCSKEPRACLVVMSLPRAPEDAYFIDLDKLTFSPAGLEGWPAGAEIPKVEISVVQVPSTDGVSVPVNVWLPEELAEGKKLPVIVSMHGGPAGTSQLKWDPIALFFINHGYAWVAPNVRGSAGFGRDWEKADDGKNRMKSVEDMQSVGKWAAQQPWADAERLVLYGGSYGG